MQARGPRNLSKRTLKQQLDPFYLDKKAFEYFDAKNENTAKHLGFFVGWFMSVILLLFLLIDTMWIQGTFKGSGVDDIIFARGIQGIGLGLFTIIIGHLCNKYAKRVIKEHEIV